MQAFTIDELHGDKRLSVGLAGFVYLTDEGVVERRRGFRLAQESLAGNRVLERGLRQELERDLSVEHGVLGEEDLSHSSLSQGVQDGEVAQRLTR